MGPHRWSGPGRTSMLSIQRLSTVRRHATPNFVAGRPKPGRWPATDIIGLVTTQTASTLWLEGLDPAMVDAVHRVIVAVVDQGGAVGWLRPPSREETLDWLSGWHAVASSGRAGLVLGLHGDRIQALGGWHAAPEGPIGHIVELTKIMVHPDARGFGLGRIVVSALIDAAESAGAELAVLGVRGNNHGARRLYEAFGFTVWGVLPNGVAVDRYRFDDVRMYRQLALPSHAVVHGSAPGGIGDSSAWRT